MKWIATASNGILSNKISGKIPKNLETYEK
jgi:hypothetical protein